MITIYIPVWLIYVVLALIFGPLVWLLFELSMEFFGSIAARRALHRLTLWDSIKGYNLFMAQLRRDGKLPRRREFKWRNVTHSITFKVAPKDEKGSEDERA